MTVAELILDAVRREVRRMLPSPAVQWGTVTQSSPLEVLVDGNEVSEPVLPLDGYTATVGATVLIVQAGTRRYAIGERT